jgi:8-oxo-dGTP pyrophosphatase MutT (NUDIX family)
MSGTADGYRREAAGGPRVRTDIVDVYVFRRAARGMVEFLLLERAGEPLKGTWQPVMGHVERGERAEETALREMREEIGLAREGAAVLGMWALEQTYPYFVAQIDCIVLSPRFAVEVALGWEPTLNAEHSGAKWARVNASSTAESAELAQFHWPGQKAAVAEILREIVRK